MAQMDMGNGLLYDPKTGEVVINDKDGNQVYQFDPTKNVTNYGGQSYAGRYNPVALGSIADSQVTSAYDPLIAGQEKYTDVKTKAGQYWQNLKQAPADQIAFNSAYTSANKNLSSEQQSFFDTLRSMAETRDPSLKPKPRSSTLATGEYAGIEDISTIIDNPNLTDSVKQAILQNLSSKGELPGTQNEIQNNLNKLNDRQQSTQPQTNVNAAQAIPTVSQSVQPTQATTSQTTQQDSSSSQQNVQPDYNGFLQELYTQVSPSQASLSSSQNSFSSTPDTTTNASSYASSPFSIGGGSTIQKSNPVSSNSILGGYSAQSNYQESAGQLSGKGQPSQSNTSSSGMSTGKFGSK